MPMKLKRAARIAVLSAACLAGSAAVTTAELPASSIPFDARHYSASLAAKEGAAVPRVFAAYDVTIHVPRRPYARALPGIPTIRPFEALACAIPLVSAPWEDAERLFRPGDFLVARTGDEMRRHLPCLLADRDMRRELAARGLETVRTRHTCAHRVDELLTIYAELETGSRERTVSI